MPSHETKFSNLASDLGLAIVIDSIKGKEIVIHKEKLIERGLSHGFYIFMLQDPLENAIKARGNTQIVTKFLSGWVGKSFLDILVKFLRQKSFSYTTIFIDNGVSQGVTSLVDMVLANVSVPSNGNIDTRNI